VSIAVVRALGQLTGAAGAIDFGAGVALTGERAALAGAGFAGSLGVGAVVIAGIRANGSWVGIPVLIDTGTYLKLIAGLRIAPLFSAERLVRVPFTALPRIREGLGADAVATPPFTARPRTAPQLAGGITIGPEEPH
jgi:hypothetical protein